MQNTLLLTLTLFALAGCASQRLSDAEKSNIVKNFIVAEKLNQRTTISAFNLDSWISLSDQYLILRTSPFKPYLIQLFTHCDNLDFSPTLLIRSNIPNSLSAGFDSVYTQDDFGFKCNISRIYPLSKAQQNALISAVNLADKHKPNEQPAITEKNSDKGSGPAMD